MKKIITLLLSITLLGGFMTGCAKSEEEKAKDAIEDAADAAKDTME